MRDIGGNVKVIFGEALDCATPAEQAAYLDRACGGDTALRARVEALLRVHQQAGHFLQGPPAPADGSRAEAPGAEAPGMVLGPYQLLELIGEGGFGMVYRAEQRQPVRRLVALKVLRPGMDGRQVIARFEAERQALALMNHPHIARVLDAGEAPPAYAGGPPRPYFVMELVEGVPLMDFCDQERLTPRERLELFVSVCQAVQHAHQKGIIHRDLKPSNVLVTPQEGAPLTLPSPPAGGEGRVRGVVKVIDFGIAKALEQRLTDKTLVTGVAQVVGTPLYMSPEQAEPGAGDIDTRSDIYSLGVVLYELLTGTTPFDRERLREVSFDELRRIIREEEPPRPSTRISTLGPAAVTLSEQRRTDPRQLGQLLRGELDWIVMKCLEKERSRRYETADALARDVARYLADEPVEACPPSATYRLGKFLRKHRRPLVTAAAFLVLLAAAGVLAGWNYVREAQAERDRAVTQTQREGAVRAALDRARALRVEARQERDPGKRSRAREQVQRALTLVESGPADEALAAQVRQVQEELDEEEKDRTLLLALEKARLAAAETVSRQNRFAFERAVPLLREALRSYGLPPGVGDPATAAARIGQRPAYVREALLTALDDWLILASYPGSGIVEPHADWLRTVLVAAKSPDGWERRLHAASAEKDLAQRRAALEKLEAEADVEKLPARSLVKLFHWLQSVEAQASAVRLLRRARQQYPDDFWVNLYLGVALQAQTPPDWDEAVRFLTTAVALRPDSPGCHLNLGAALQQKGRLDEAVACFKKALALDPNYAAAHHNLGVARSQLRQFEEAIASCRQAVALDPKDAEAHNSLGIALAGKGQWKEALASYRQAIALDPKYAEAHHNLGNLLCDVKRDYDGAVACFRKAVELEPKNAVFHYNLGNALMHKGQLDLALASFRKAVEFDPKDASAHYNLGSILAGKGRSDEAAAHFRQTIALDPTHARAHNNLGAFLCDVMRDYDGAVACFRKAIKLDPEYAVAHNNLGLALKAKGQADLAIASFRKAIELDPKNAQTRCNLGRVLCDAKQDYDAAIACFRRAIELNPDLFLPRFGLARALERKGEVDQAIDCYRKAIELNPNHAQSHCNLGLALQTRGRFREALASLRRGHDLGARQPGWPYPSPGWIKQCERCVQLDDLLAATRQGQARPAGPAECLELADFCRGAKQCPAAAVRFYTEAFTAQPKLAADLQAAHRSRAAQAAALAGCGQGDGASLDAAERARLRRQALDWLRADLALWTKELKTASRQTGQAALARMQQWLSEPSLAGLRDASGFAALPAEERARWQDFWADVAAARTRGAEAQKQPANQPTLQPEKK